MPKKRPVLRYIVPILIIIISILFFIIMIKNKPEPVQKDAQERAWAVESVLVKKDNYTPILTLYGQTITESDIQLTSTIEADVIKRHVKLGDSVKEGQILLTLDKSRFEQFKQQRLADLNEIEAMITNEKHQFETDQSLLAQESALLKIAKNSVSRAKTLEKSAMASSSQLDDAKRTELQQKLAITRLKANISNHPTRLAQLEAKKQRAQSLLNLANDDLSKTAVISPISGIITTISVDNGEHVRQGTALFSITDSHNLEIQSSVPKAAYNSLRESFKKRGLVTATVKIDNRSLRASLDRLSSNINKGQASSYAFFTLNDTTNSLLVGQTVTIYAELDQAKNSVAIPHDAIYGTETAFIIQDQRLKKIKVNWLGETFINSRKYILVSSKELKNNDELLISKFANAMHGLKVKTNNIKSISNADE